MPRIPQVTPRRSLRGGATPRATPQQFGAGIGRGIQGVGIAIGQIAQRQEAIARRDLGNSVANARVSYYEQVAELKGISRQSVNTVESAQEYHDTFSDDLEGIISGLKEERSPEFGIAFDTAISSRKARDIEGSINYGFAQTQAFRERDLQVRYSAMSQIPVDSPGELLQFADDYNTQVESDKAQGLFKPGFIDKVSAPFLPAKAEGYFYDTLNSTPELALLEIKTGLYDGMLSSKKIRSLTEKAQSVVDDMSKSETTVNIAGGIQRHAKLLQRIYNPANSVSNNDIIIALDGEDQAFVDYVLEANSNIRPLSTSREASENWGFTDGLILGLDNDIDKILDSAGTNILGRPLPPDQKALQRELAEVNRIRELLDPRDFTQEQLSSFEGRLNDIALKVQEQISGNRPSSFISDIAGLPFITRNIFGTQTETGGGVVTAAPFVAKHPRVFVPSVVDKYSSTEGLSGNQTRELRMEMYRLMVENENENSEFGKGLPFRNAEIIAESLLPTAAENVGIIRKPDKEKKLIRIQYTGQNADKGFPAPPQGAIDLLRGDTARYSDSFADKYGADALNSVGGVE